MDVNKVRNSPEGLDRNRIGTKAHFMRKASPLLNSTRKNATFKAIKAYVTTGNVLREESSSPIGSIYQMSFF
jgi:hypothetical protein